MSHRCVEQIIGRLVSDERFRRQFRDAPERLLGELAAAGIIVTASEQRALVETPPASWTEMAARLDPRLQKVSLRKEDTDGHA
jgi:hypothetical protein